MPTKSAILDALGAILDPDYQQDIVSLGFVTDLHVRAGHVDVELELTSPNCSAKDWFKRQAEQQIRGVAGVHGVHVRMTARPDADPSPCDFAAGTRFIPAVTLTAPAVAALREAGLQDGDFLRIGVTPGGCSGHTYSASIDRNPAPDDLVLQDDAGLRIVTDPDSAPFLDGLQIDYSDDLIRSGFRFSNPNAGGSCGCGASFKANS